MGINIGPLLHPCWRDLAQSKDFDLLFLRTIDPANSWHFALAAAVGMGIGLIAR